MSTLAPGMTLSNRYRISRLLSDKGGFGVLYEGLSLASHQKVAIKQNRAKPTDPDYTESCEQFHREADMLRALRHPNLVRFEEYFEDPSGAQFLVMEFIPGDDLLDLAQRQAQPFPEAQVLEWGRILCNVLAYLHSQTPPIIHRDLKPQNVKLQPDGRLVLVDFGIAKVFKPGQKTLPGALGCSSGFSPVEQYHIAGLYGTGTTERTDIYALGATLYFLLTQQIPTNAMERYARQLAINPLSFNPTLSAPTVNAITKAMQIKPEDRFQTAAEMGQALAQAQQALGVVSPPPIGISAKVCPACGTTNRGAARFCQKCRSPLMGIAPVAAPIQRVPVPCPRCGYPVRLGARFCSQCRTSLPWAISAPAPSVPFDAAQGRACGHCGTLNRAGARICKSCGTPLVSLPAMPQMPLPLIPSPPPIPTQPGQCPRCGQVNSPSEVYCQRCGYQLQPVSPSVSQPAQPIPVTASAQQSVLPVPSAGSGQAPVSPLPQPSGPLPEQFTVGWILFALGVAAIVLGLWQWLGGLPLTLAIPLIALGIFTALAGRDLLDLFDSARGNAPVWLAFVFGDANRGRRMGTIAATLWFVIGCATAWLVLPLTLVGGMAFVLNVLISERLVRSVGGHYARPGLVTLIGWLLVFTGIGAIPGVALLIPKPWAQRAASAVLALLAALAAGGVLIALANLNTPASGYPLGWTVPGTGISAFVAGLLTSSATLLIGSLAAMRYLSTVKLNLTQTAMRRELNVAAWMLFVTGWVMFVLAFAWVGLPWGVQAFVICAVIGTLAVLGGRDLLNLGAAYVACDPERGRRMGILAAAALAVVSAAMAWQFYPIIFLAIAIFLLRVLMGAQAILLCSGKPGAPAGVTLIACALIPTGIGSFPGILMLQGNAQGWRWARPTLVVLGAAGLALAWWVWSSEIQGATSISPVNLTLISSSIALAVGAGVALRYLQSPVVRKYFGV
jgi:hypothetical protein